MVSEHNKGGREARIKKRKEQLKKIVDGYKETEIGLFLNQALTFYGCAELEHIIE